MKKKTCIHEKIKVNLLIFRGLSSFLFFLCGRVLHGLGDEKESFLYACKKV